MTTTATSQAGLFARLEPLLAHRAVLITVSKLEGDQLQVNICPRQLKESENPAVCDRHGGRARCGSRSSDLPLRGLHSRLNTNLAAIEKEITEAEKAARGEAKKRHKIVGNGGKKATDSAATTASSAFSKPETEP